MLNTPSIVDDNNSNKPLVKNNMNRGHTKTPGDGDNEALLNTTAATGKENKKHHIFKSISQFFADGEPFKTMYGIFLRFAIA